LEGLHGLQQKPYNHNAKVEKNNVFCLQCVQGHIEWLLFYAWSSKRAHVYGIWYSNLLWQVFGWLKENSWYTKAELAYKFMGSKSHQELVEDTKRFVMSLQLAKEQTRHNIHNSSGMGWGIYATITKAHCKYA